MSASEAAKKLDKYSPKIACIVKEITDHPNEKQYLYSAFNAHGIKLQEYPTLSCLDSTKTLHDAIFANECKKQALQDVKFHWNEVSKALSGLPARQLKTKFGVDSVPLACDSVQSALLFGINTIIAERTRANENRYDRENAQKTMRLFEQMLIANDCLLTHVSKETVEYNKSRNLDKEVRSFWRAEHVIDWYTHKTQGEEKLDTS
eukprot:jgi/Mesvir1/17081/Mv00983-RA.1